MPFSYIPYDKNPITGQAILGNIARNQRILKYAENDKVFNKIIKGIPYYETEVLEQVGDKNTKNIVMRGECLSSCAYLKKNNIKVDLVYIDPPFASGADYAKKIYIRQNPKLRAKIAEADKNLEIDEIKAFEEKMYGDIWNKEDYLNWMYENLLAIKEVMSETASIYVHLDWHIGHYVKILMDEVFGEDNFINEIIWSYRSGGASKKSSIARKHDSIYFYTNNTDLFEINTINERQYLDKKFIDTKVDENGKFYVDTILTDTLSGVIHRVLDNGKIKDYNCRPVLNVSKERVEYATQKPEGLLELLIEISSKKDMLVADFFGGSGVCSKVASDLGRNFIHADVGINSIQTVRDRLMSTNASFKILEVKDGVNLFRNPAQTMDKLRSLIPNLTKEKPEGINKFWYGVINSSSDGVMPVYLPDLKDSSTKVLDEVLINTIVNNEIYNFDNFTEEVKKVIIYYIDIDDEKSLKEFIKQNNNTLIEIEFRDLKQVLDFVVLDDVIEYEVQKDILYTVNITKFISDRVIQKIDEYNKKKNIFNTDKAITLSENGLELIEYISLDCTNSDGVWKSDSEIKIDKKSFVFINGEKTKGFWNGEITCSKEPKRLKVRNILGDETIINIT